MWWCAIRIAPRIAVASRDPHTQKEYQSEKILFYPEVTSSCEPAGKCLIENTVLLGFRRYFIDPQNPLMYPNHPMTQGILENWLLNDTYFKFRSIGLGIFHLLFHQGI